MPELVADVLAPATRMNDLGVKRDYYLDVGVRELSLADAAAKSLVRALLSSFDEERASADTLTSVLLPGFSLMLAQSVLRGIAGICVRAGVFGHGVWRSHRLQHPTTARLSRIPSAGREAKRRTEALRGGSQVGRKHLDVTVGGLKGRPCLLA